jgi:tRNA(fMet)-specific endonuclease VapC
MVKYLLDTDSLSYYLRGEGQIAFRLQSLTPADIGIPAPVLYESRHGMLRLSAGPRETASLSALNRAVETLDVVPFDAHAAEAAARVRTRLERTGAAIGPIDVQIAGIAISLSATLVTRNVPEFSRIEKLAIDNWYDR